MDGVFKRGKTYHFRYRAIGGKQLRVTLATEDEAEAYRRAATIKAGPDEYDSKVWAAELAAYLADRTAKGRMSATTNTLRSAVLTQFAKMAAVTAPRFVTAPVIQRWYNWLRTRTKPAAVSEETAQTYVRWLRTFLSYLGKKGYPMRMPAALELPRVKRRMRQPFCTAEQVAQLIAAATDDEMRFILYAGFHAGLRRGEIAEARPEWFDLKNGLLSIERSETWEPKDRDNRTIPLTKDFAAFLEKWGLKSPFLLEGKKMNRPRRWRYRYDFRKPFDALMAGHGMEWVTPHTMRRTFASLKVSAGVSLYKVAVWLGDMESVVQDHYGYLLPKDAEIERGLSPTPAMFAR